MKHNITTGDIKKLW